jgi:hypothetical protein
MKKLIVFMFSVILLGSCNKEELVYGCTDPNALNYEPNANVNEWCEYAKLGDTAFGGIVFHIDSNGRSFIAFKENFPSYMRIGIANGSNRLGSWAGSYCNDILMEAFDTAIGTGYSNSILINDGCVHGQTYPLTNAAQNCLSINTTFPNYLYPEVLVYYRDWYLPSRDELYKIYETIGPANWSTFGNILGKSGSYWSSSEVDSSRAWCVNFINSAQIKLPKNYPSLGCILVRSNPSNE